MKLLALILLILGCGGPEITQVQRVEGQATIVARIEIAFPTCEGIEDDALLVECIKNVRIAIEASGLDLSEEQIKVLAEIEKLGDSDDEDDSAD